MRTITAPADVDRLFAQGRRISRPALTVLAVQTPEARDPSGRVLFVAGKRLGSAVLRNRCKRVLREAVRRAGRTWPGWDLALVARPATAQAAPGDLDRALTAALAMLGVDV